MAAAPSSTTAAPPPAPAGPLIPGHRPMTLQARLMAAVIGFVSLVLAVVAIVTSSILGAVVEGRLQETLGIYAGKVNQQAVSRTVLSSDHLPPDAESLLSSSGTRGSFVMVFPGNGPWSGAAIADDGTPMSLDRAQITEAVDAARRGDRSVTISGLGSYQFQSWTVTIPSGIPNAQPIQFQVFAGLSRTDVQQLLTSLFTIIAITTIGGLILLALSTAITIRVSLRPLRAIAATANRVANQPLDRGDVSIQERVPSAEADPRTETGLVGAALNTLLDHVDASLAVRQRNEERMRQFVADASHELRTPLASIRGYSELSLRALGQSSDAETPATASAHTALERIQAQSLRMTSLVEDLLLLARLEEGRELSLSTVDLSRLVIEGVADARPTGPEHIWELDVPADPVEIEGDLGRLQQVVTNLLANARTHTPAGTRISIGVAAAGPDAIIRVHDDGPGIDPAIRDALFSRFARGDRSRTRATGGSGLGLSITKAIVDGHGGTIEVESEPGGTTFTLRLPRAQAGAARPAPRTAETPTAPSASPAPSSPDPAGARTPSEAAAPATPGPAASAAPRPDPTVWARPSSDTPVQEADLRPGGHDIDRSIGGR